MAAVTTIVTAAAISVGVTTAVSLATGRGLPSLQTLATAAIIGGATAGFAPAGTFNIGGIAGVGGISVSKALVSGAAAGSLAGITSVLAPQPQQAGLEITGGSAQTVRVPPGSAQYAFGICATDGQMAFLEVDDRTLHMAWAISECPIEDVLGLKIDNRPVTYDREWDKTPAGDRLLRLTGTGEWAGALYIEVYMDPPPHNGDKLTINGDALCEASAVWRSEHALPCAWAYIRCTHLPKQTKPLYAHVPSLRWHLKGIRCTWPGQDEPKWTRNAAAVRWFYESQIMGRTMDEATFQDAYDTCGAVLRAGGITSTGDDQIRYAIDGVAFGPYEQNAVQMDMAMQGHLIWRNEAWQISPGKARTALKTMGRDDVLDVLDLSYTPSRDTRVNRVTAGVLASIEDDFEPVDLPPLVDTTLRKLDTVDQTLPLSRLRFVGDTGQAGRIMRTALYRARGAGKMRLRVVPGTSFENYAVRRGDVLDVELPSYGAFGDRWVVREPIANPDGSLTLGLTLELLSTYDDVLYDAYPTGRPLPLG